MMLETLYTAELALLLVSGFFLAYLAFLSLLSALEGRLQEISTAGVPTRRFAFIIPAHNEQLYIARAVQSLQALDYPADLFDIVVVADNCTDDTARIARTCGAHVLERFDEHRRSKGHALAWCTVRLLDHTPAYDAFAIMDADTVAEPSFLRVMDEALNRGAEAVQAANVAVGANGPWNPEVSRIALLLFNVVKQSGRMVFGLSAGLRGNGMCFTARLFRRIPWRAFGLAEDADYSLTLVENGVSVHFARNAVVRATIPNDPANALKQRSRWEAGRFSLIRTHTLPLLRRLFNRRGLIALDALVDLYTPPFTNMAALALAAVTVRGSLLVAGLGTGPELFVAWTAVALFGLLHVIVGLWSIREHHLLARAFTLFPRYVVWKFRLYAGVLATVTAGEWVRTPREGSRPSGRE